MALLAGLLAITRLDTVLLTGPVLLWRAYPHWRERRLWAGLAVGFAPLFLWELFSIVYYGFPFPNTYYAKLAAGIPAWALARQGMGYCLSVLNQDPITVLTLGGGLVMPFLLGARRLWPVAAGLLLYSLYVVRAGGDFMLGRFFAAPFVGAVVVLVTGLRPLLAERGVALFAPAALVLALGVTITPRPTLKSDGSYALPSPNGEHPFDDRGISDERAYYYPNMGLLHVARDKNMPSDQRVIEGQALQPGKVSRRWAAGTIGWGAPPRAIILDELALSDPLLARLPAIRNKWRIGHLARRVPDGYVATLETGKNQLADKGLAQIWDRLSLVVTGPLWSWSRFQAIAWLNSGRYRPLIDVERYAKP
jgi:arabinofuranosyltransferase